MRRLPLHGYLLVFAALLGCESEPASSPKAAVDLLRVDQDSEHFAKAIGRRDFDFPRDHGAHPEFRSEWWYITGNLEHVAEPDRQDNRPFGFQITLFRFALPVSVDDTYGWQSDQLWVAQFAVSDLQGSSFFSGQRSARGAAGLAGAQENGRRVWVEDVFIEGLDSDEVRIRARDASFGMDLSLEPQTPVVLNGDQGLSQKGRAEGNASYYYAIPRLLANGSLNLDGIRIPVSGTAWLDREWSTSALDAEQEGWDWFALHFDDGRNLMVYRLRGADGTTGPYSSLTFSDADGIMQQGNVGEGDLMPTEYWISPETGSNYPVRWTIRLADGQLDVRAAMSAQEHPDFFRYWEGAVTFSGTVAGQPVSGTGYLEMTGY